MLIIYSPPGFEERFASRAKLTPEQLKDPKVQERLNADADVVPLK